MQNTKYEIRMLVFCCLVLTFCQFSRAATNTVTREIRYEKGDVWVEDSVHLEVAVCQFISELRDLIKQEGSREGNTLEVVKRVLKGEDLEVSRYEVKIQDRFMNLKILSRVKVDYAKPAKLHFVASYVGYDFSRRAAPGEESQMEILIYAGNGGRVLWFPEWKVTRDAVTAVPNLVNSDYLSKKFVEGRTDLELRCFLETGQNVDTLFYWSEQASTPNAPDEEFLARLDHSHRIGGNDLFRIFTRFKLAKPGYYAIDVSGFTNKPLILAPGARGLTTRPLTPSELDAMDARLAGTPLRKNPKTKFVMDGSFDDWKEYKTAWNADSAGVPGGMGSEQFFSVTECCYCNDGNYLYVFLKFSPTIQQRHERLNAGGTLNSLGNVCFLYLDSDADRRTGAQRPAVDSEAVGVDIMISVTAGAYFYMAGQTVKETGCEVVYDISTWDSGLQRFGMAGKEESSRREPPLINHGKDGVEMAILLSDIAKKSGDKFDLIFEDGSPFPRFHRVAVKIE